jgi:hypothetical protein
MIYKKPEILNSTKAINTIQGQEKDSLPIESNNMLSTVGAYEADE